MFRGDTIVEENWSSFHSRHSGDYFSQVTQRNILFDPDDHDHPKRRGFRIFWTLLSCTSAEAAVVIGGPPTSASSVSSEARKRHLHSHRTTSITSTTSSIASASTFHRRQPSVQKRHNGSLLWQPSPSTRTLQERFGTLQ